MIWLLYLPRLPPPSNQVHHYSSLDMLYWLHVKLFEGQSSLDYSINYGPFELRPSWVRLRPKWWSSLDIYVVICREGDFGFKSLEDLPISL